MRGKTMALRKQFWTIPILLFALLSLSGCGDELSEEEARSLAGGGGGGVLAAADMNILVLGHEIFVLFSDPSSASTALAGMGFAGVNSVDILVSTPSLATIQTYDAVAVWSVSGINDAIGLGNSLATYIDGGGGVVTASFVNWPSVGISLGGNFKSGGYSPFNFNASNPNTLQSMSTILVPGHPILNSFTAMTTTKNSSPTLAPGGIEISRWGDGRTALAVNIPGTVASFTFTPSNPTTVTGDYALLLANALVWVANN